MGTETKIGPPAIPDHFRHFIPPESLPGLYYRWLVRPHWRGPFYFLRGAWLDDLQNVLFLLACMVKVGAPLPKGLDVAAVDAVENVRFQEHKHIRTSILLMGILCAICAIMSILLYELYIYNDFKLLVIIVLYLLLAPCIVVSFILPKTRKQALLLHMRDRLESGCQLSEVMRGMNRFFPAVYADMIQAGENSGRMEECFALMMDRVKHTLDMRRKTAMAIKQTAANVLIMVGIVTFLIFKVFPVFNELRLEFHVENAAYFPNVYPYFWLLDVRVNFSTAATILPIALILLGALAFIMRQRGWNAGLWSSIGLCLPWFRILAKYSNLFYLSLELEMLLSAGMPAARAISQTSESEVNVFYKRALRQISARVENGTSLADAFAAHPFLFTPRFIDGLRLGEYSGQIPSMLDEFSKYAGSIVKNRYQVFYEIHQPILTLILAGFVGSVMVYTFSMLTSIADTLVLW